jgi:dTDP-4-dehydrorhamnose 3,5-epimerase-like enzyme
MLQSKYTIENLPVTDQFLREKRLIQERGELVLLSDGEEIRHITFFTLRPGPGFFRGGHYHRRKSEKFYVVSGHARLQLADVDTGETAEIDLLPGRRVTVCPMCAHRFVAVTETQVIEYYATPFDLSDDIPFEGFTGDPLC